MGGIGKSGGYRELAAFQTATIIYDATVWFCERFIDPHSRAADQMVQAARNGRQNIAQGSRAGAACSQTDLRLFNIARASLEELLLDCGDFLRHRRLSMWEFNSPEAMAVREPDPSDLTDLTDQERFALYAEWLEHEQPDVRVNAIICLIHQANDLLDQHTEVLEKQVVAEGACSEKPAATRLKERQKNNPADPVPECRQCGKPMVLRTAKNGKNAGHQFWGCSAYPECRSVEKV